MKPKTHEMYVGAELYYSTVNYPTMPWNCVCQRWHGIGETKEEAIMDLQMKIGDTDWEAVTVHVYERPE